MMLGRMAIITAREPRSANAPRKLMRTGVFLGALAFSSPTLAESAADGRAYRLAPGDRLTMTVLGQADLSGDVLVDGQGNILLPIIGPIKVEDLTPFECQKLIHDRLADGIINQPSVSVRISELRPLYVLGDVRAPGAYSFRYGSTVKSAVAAAGGFGRAELPQNAAISDFLLADERVRQLTFQKQALLVRLQRLEAQRDGKSTFSSPSLLGPAEERDIAQTVANEKETFESQADVLQKQLQVLRSQKPRIQNEIEALNGQAATAKKQIALYAQYSEQYGRLMKQGLGTANAELQLKLAEASQESELWRLTAQISRLQMDIGEIDIKSHDIESTFMKQVVADLREVRERLRELDVTLPSARELREVKLRQAGNVAEIEVSRSFSITRTKNHEAVVIQASDTMLLEPGDLIEVKQLLPRGAQSGNAPSWQTGPLAERTEALRDGRAIGSASR
jgi:polysaccharide export outer membrane protein